MKNDERILVLGGAGLVGARVVRSIARELPSRRRSCGPLHRSSVGSSCLTRVGRRFPTSTSSASGATCSCARSSPACAGAACCRPGAHREGIYRRPVGADRRLWATGWCDWCSSIRPDVVVDCINTATAISYQDVESLVKTTHEHPASWIRRSITRTSMPCGPLAASSIARFGRLMISQSVHAADSTCAASAPIPP